MLLRHQGGSMLVIAVFIITVMSLLGLATVQLLRDGGDTVTYEVFGARAFNAANSGAESNLRQIFPVSGTGTCADSNLNLSAQSAFAGCTVVTSCKSFAVTQTSAIHYRVVSTATCQGGDYTAERSVAVEARRSN